MHINIIESHYTGQGFQMFQNKLVTKQAKSSNIRHWCKNDVIVIDVINLMV